MKKAILLLLILRCFSVAGQVGINTTLPNAQLDVRSSNQATPSNTDGMLIPKVDVFPATNPTAAQQGMLVFLTTASGPNQPGFYYWNNPTSTWIGVGNGTANQWNLTGNNNTSAAANFIGTTNNQDLIFRRNNLLSGRIADGNTFFGKSAGAAAAGNLNTYIGTDAGSLNVSGTQNVFVGRLAGGGGSSGSDNIFIGNAAGLFNTADNNMFIGSFAGNANTTGGGNMFIGNLSGSLNAAGTQNTFIGNGSGTTNASGSRITLIGNGSSVGSGNLTNANAIGASSRVTANNALVLGAIAGVNFAPASTNVGIGTTAPSATLDVANPTGGVLIPRVALTNAGTAAPVLNPNGGVLPESTLVYNTATAGVSPDDVIPGFYFWSGTRWLKVNSGENVPTYYVVNGTTTIATTPTAMAPMTDMQVTFTSKSPVVIVMFSASGFVANGGCGQGAVFFNILVDGVVQRGWQTSTEDVTNVTNRPIWDTAVSVPIAVPVGTPTTIQVNWGFPGCGNAINTVQHPVVVSGFAMRAGRSIIITDPNGNSGMVNVNPPVLADRWTTSGNSGLSDANFIGTTDNTDLIFRRNNTQSGAISTNNLVFGVSSLPLSGTGINNTAFGNSAFTTARSGSNSSAFGFLASSPFNVSESTAVGARSNATGNNSTAIGFRALASTDDSLVLGSVAGFNGAAATVNVGIGVTAPAERLHVAGRALFHDGFSADNAALLYRNNTDYMFLGPQSGSTADGSSLSLYGSTNTSNSNAGGLSMFTTGVERFKLTSGGLLGIGATPTRKLHVQETAASTTLGQMYLEQSGTGDAFMHMGATGSRHFNLGVDVSADSFKLSTNATVPGTLTAGTLITVQATGEVGIGTTVPAQKLHVSGPAGLTAVRIANTSTTGTTSNVALDFFRQGAANTDWQFYNLGPALTIGNSGDDLATVNDLYQFQGSRFMPMNDATQSLGQAANRWNTLFASNGTINTSDARQKKNIQDLNYGLDEIMQLRPVSFEWIKDDGSGTKLGLIAQELQQILPETVRDWDWSEDGKTKVPSAALGVYYSDIIPVLIKGIQDQQRTIESLHDEVKQLKSQLVGQDEILERLGKLEEQ